MEAEKIEDAEELTEGQELPKQVTGFRLGNDYYAVSVLDVQEVIRPQFVTPVPLTQEHIRGLINLRGQIVTSLSLHHLLKMEGEEKEDHMNVIVRGKDGLFALTVDEILDVMNVDNESFEKNPENFDSNLKNYSKGVYKLSDKILILLDLKKITEISDS